MIKVMSFITVILIIRDFNPAELPMHVVVVAPHRDLIYLHEVALELRRIPFHSHKRLRENFSVPAGWM